jgi:proline dehydrogenase
MNKNIFADTQTAFAAKTDKELKKAYWLFRLVKNPKWVRTGKVLLNIALKIGFPIKWIIKPTVFNHFCGGETIKECEKTTKLLGIYNIGTILDYSAEGSKNEKSFDDVAEKILETITKASEEENIPFAVFKVTGIGRFELLMKKSSHKTLTEEENLEFNRVLKRVEKLCNAAFQSQTPLLIDAEESWIQNAIDELAMSMMKKYNKEKTIVFNTLQMYRNDRLKYLKEIHELSRKNGFFAGLKLVRGAYLEKENERALEKGYLSPIYATKEDTDNAYNQALEYCLDNIEEIAICAGTHNEYSCQLLTQMIEEKAYPKNHSPISFSQLLGMSDHISFNLAKSGYNVTKYVPFGPVRSVIPYLLRRAEENSSVQGQTGRELKLISKEIKRRKN